MSVQDHRSAQSTTPSLGEPAFNGCIHHQQMQRPISPPIQKITRIPPPAPKLTNTSSTEITQEHNCTCTHHHNILPQHYHHHHHHHHRQNIQPFGFGQSRHHQMSPPIQHEQNNELNQSPAAETHIISQQNSNIGHHSYIPFNLNASSQNVCQNLCECGHGSAHEQSGRSSRIVSTDENNPSGSEDSGRKCSNRMNKLTSDEQRSGVENKQQDNNGGGRVTSNRSDEMKFINRIERYSDSVDVAIKNTEGDIVSEEELGPPLPPRPPPRVRNVQTTDNATHSTGVRKYVVWCLICGGISCLLGVMFLGVYFLVRSYTSTVGYFETVPTFVPATLLMLTGLCIMSLARRRNRYSYLIKLSGACGLASALTCALVTVTTTVLHMSRLQALKECEYTKKTRTCTCYPIVNDPQQSDDGVDEVAVRFVFDSSDECTIVHSALYSCLRAVFGLSVAGVLVAVFSCMLVYQLLSHERKKMYWEQLELRCRSLYAGPQPPTQVSGGPSIIGTPRGGPCRCCEQCHSHRNIPSAYPWDSDNRFWTPAPGSTGNFYSPNPGGEEHMSVSNRSMNQGGPIRNQRPGWSWPRLPWQRNDPQRFRQTPSSPDSQYGFSNSQNGPDPNNIMPSSAHGGYTVIGPPHYGVWGPPPPYSDPNSPARRGRYQYIHPSQCQQLIDHNIPAQQSNLAILECHQHSSSNDSHHTIEPFCSQQQNHRTIIKRQGFKTKENYENTPSDSDGPRDRFSNTLPVRKTKKRVEIGAKSIGPNQPTSRINVQNVFSTSGQQQVSSNANNREYHDHDHDHDVSGNVGTNLGGANTVTEAGGSNHIQLKQRRPKAGVENCGFMSAENGDEQKLEPTESEVYFADVSSCCNNSVKNDHFYDETNQRRLDKYSKEENEDYLVQRYGKREASIRSRAPFPQMIPEDYEKPQMNIPLVAPRPSLIHKDISRQSMCSIDSGEKTDFTDLSPATPATPGCGFGQNYTIVESQEQHYQSRTHFATTNNYKKPDFSEPSSSSFVASFPFSCNEQSQEAHRRSTKNIQEIFLAPDAQYEIISESNQFDNSSSLNYDNEIAFNSQASHFHKPKSPKNIVVTPIKRQNLGTNISAIIQNLGGSDAGLLYPDGRRDNDSIMETQDCISNKSKTISDNEWSDHSDRRL